MVHKIWKMGRTQYICYGGCRFLQEGLGESKSCNPFNLLSWDWQQKIKCIISKSMLKVSHEKYVYLVYVFYKNIVKSVQHFIIVILVEAGEHHLDVFI